MRATSTKWRIPWILAIVSEVPDPALDARPSRQVDVTFQNPLGEDLMRHFTELVIHHLRPQCRCRRRRGGHRRSCGNGRSPRPLVDLEGMRGCRQFLSLPRRSSHGLRPPRLEMFETIAAFRMRSAGRPIFSLGPRVAQGSRFSHTFLPPARSGRSRSLIPSMIRL
jgi:hypothetical protein